MMKVTKLIYIVSKKKKKKKTTLYERAPNPMVMVVMVSIPADGDAKLISH